MKDEHDDEWPMATVRRTATSEANIRSLPAFSGGVCQFSFPRRDAFESSGEIVALELKFRALLTLINIHG
jgi:hypothetical protein